MRTYGDHDSPKFQRATTVALLTFAIGILLAVGYGVWLYRPSETFLIGVGGDPLFNLWNFEFVWHQLGQMGPFSIFSDSFWSSNIFWPQPLTLALSENQIFPALILWPLRMITGNGTLALGLGGLLFHGMGFVFAFLWLRRSFSTQYSTLGAILIIFAP
jgi:hypothetical protein